MIQVKLCLCCPLAKEIATLKQSLNKCFTRPGHIMHGLVMRTIIISVGLAVTYVYLSLKLGEKKCRPLYVDQKMLDLLVREKNTLLLNNYHSLLKHLLLHVGACSIFFMMGKFVSENIYSKFPKYE